MTPTQISSYVKEQYKYETWNFSDQLESGEGGTPNTNNKKLINSLKNKNRIAMYFYEWPSLYISRRLYNFSLLFNLFNKEPI